MLRFLFYILIALASCLPTLATTQVSRATTQSATGFDTWQRGFRIKAIAAGISSITFDAAFSDIRYDLGKGLIMSDLVISEPGDESTPFLKARQIYCKIPLIPLIKKKTVIIPHLGIDTAQINLTQLDKNLWNFSDLLDKKTQSSEKTFKILQNSHLMVKFMELIILKFQ